MHNGRVRCYWATHDIIGIREVNNDDLVLVIDLFPNAYEAVRFKCEGLWSCESQKVWVAGLSYLQQKEVSITAFKERVYT
jgi:hypothetical protein